MEHLRESSVSYAGTKLSPATRAATRKIRCCLSQATMMITAICCYLDGAKSTAIGMELSPETGQAPRRRRPSG